MEFFPNLCIIIIIMRNLLFKSYFNFIVDDPADFVKIDSLSLNFPAYSPIGTAKCVNVTIIDDNITENNESFSIILEAPKTINLFPNSSKIIDNDSKLHYVR